MSRKLSLSLGYLSNNLYEFLVLCLLHATLVGLLSGEEQKL